MGTITKEIDIAIKSLNIRPELFLKLEKEQNEKLYEILLDKFVKSGNRRWWWEDFKLSSYTFEEDPDRIEQLRKILADIKETVWFMPEDDENDFYPIYEATPNVIPAILSECFLFSIYIFQIKRPFILNIISSVSKRNG